MQAIMFDLETLGRKRGCIVPSIGAMSFNATECFTAFKVNIDVEDQEKHGLTCEASTVKWWLEQSKDAQRSLFAGDVFKLKYALESLNNSFNWSQIGQVWCNGADFDFPILAGLYEAAGITPPWKYFNQRCYRTFKNQFRKTDYNRYKVDPQLAHDSLSDTHAQILTMQNLLAAVDNKEIKWLVL